jgi:hypothetical protein
MYAIYEGKKIRSATDQTKHAFAATGIYPYKPKILNHLISLAKIKFLMRIWKGPKMGIQMLTFASLRTLDLRSQIFCLEHPTKYLLKIKKKRLQVK